MSKKVRSQKAEVVKKSAGSLGNTRLSLYYQVLFWAFAALLLFPPYYRGLFFPENQQIFFVLVLALFGLTAFWLLYERKESLFKNSFDYLALALVAVYVISFYDAANPRYAVQEIIKYSIYFLIFWLTSRLAVTQKEIRYLLGALYLSGVGVALAGVMTATGIIHINDGFVDKRIFSTMQYPNALANYLVALTFIGTYLWQNTGKYLKYLFVPGNAILLAVFVASGSRGVFLVLPVAFVIFLIGLPRGRRLPVIVHYALLIIGALIFNSRFIPNLEAGKIGMVWWWLLAGGLVALAGEVIKDYLLKNIKINRKMIITGVGVIILIMAVLVAVKFNTIEYTAKNLFGESMLTRLTKITPEDQNVVGRLYFDKDAFKLIKDHPVFGLGGGAWKATYFHYQSFFYRSTEVHNHYLQLWAEVGTVGFLIFAGVWLAFFVTVFNLLRKKIAPTSWFLAWAMLTTAVTLGLHAAIDFDLSLSSITIVLFGMFGLTRALDRDITPVAKKKALDPQVRNYLMIGVGVICLLAFILVGRLITASSNQFKAYSALNGGNNISGRQYLEKAVQNDPLDAQNTYNLATIYANAREGEAALAKFEKAVELDPYNFQYRLTLASFYLQSRQQERAVEQSREAIRVAPNVQMTYDELSRTLLLTGVAKLQQQKPAEAAKHFNEIDQIPVVINKRIASLTDQEKALWVREPLLHVTPRINLALGVSQYFKSNWVAAKQSFKVAAQEQQLKPDALLWQALIQNKKGNTAQAEALIKEASSLRQGIENDYNILVRLPLINK